MGKVIRIPSIRAEVILNIDEVKGYSEAGESAEHIFNDLISVYEQLRTDKFKDYFDEQIDYINKHKKDILFYIKTGFAFSQNKGSITEYD